jgi:N-methylhydantoinase B
MRSTKRLVRSDGTEEWLPSKSEDIKVKQGDLLYFNTWGGGGWGDPCEREAELVADDVARGLVTTQGARRYGVVLNADGVVDADATEALRSEMRAQREDTGLFNFGGTIEEILARCKEETHLDPPTPPTFAHQRR